MPEGPLGGPRPFVSDKRTILVLIGFDEAEPPNDVQLRVQEAVNREINKVLIDHGANIKATRQTVNLTVQRNPTPEQRNALGPGILHVEQFDIKTELSEVSMKAVNKIHNLVVDKVNELGFNIVGTETTVT